ncbi:MAG: ATP-binding protein [Sandaracinus sp.]
MPATKALARLEALAELAEALAQTRTTRDVAMVIVEQGVAAARADACSMYLPAPDAPGELDLVAHTGIAPDLVERVARLGPETKSPLFESMRTQEPLWIESPEDYARVYPWLASFAPPSSRSAAFWSVPLVAEGEAIGIVSMGFRTARRFPPDERSFVATFALHCADALRRAQHGDRERAVLAVAGRLRASLETTLRSIGDAVVTTDPAGRVTFMNPHAEVLTGWNEAEALGRPSASVFRIVSEATRTLVESPVERVLREGTTLAVPDRVLLVDREERAQRPVEHSASPIRGDDGKIEGVVLVFRDATAQRQRELRRELIERAATTLAQSLDYEVTVAQIARIAVPTLADWCAVDVLEEGAARPRQIAIAHVDPSKIALVRETSARFTKEPGATAGVRGVLDRGLSELHRDLASEEPLAVDGIAPAHLALFRALGVGSAMIVPLVARGRVLGAITFALDARGRSYSAEDLALAEDLARRCAIAIDNAWLYAAANAARKAAVLANRTKDEFLAMMSHELRTPLGSVMGWAKLLTGPSADPTLVPRGLDVIHRNAVAMGALIEDLLDLSRITSGKIRLELRTVELAKIVESAVEAVRHEAAAKDLVVRTQIDPSVGPFRGDGSRVTQILTNLLTNAVKFTPSGGTVRVTLDREAGHARISVSDTGRGIDPAFLPHVFEMFQQQEDGSGARGRGGLGLGLAISRQLVEHHGGTITAESEGVGKGARFVVRLPLATKSLEESARGEAAARGSGTLVTVAALQGIRVVTVDDDDDARAFVKAALELRGAEVRTASNVDDALALVEREVPDVVLSDIGMPMRDGYSFLAELRGRTPERGGRVPVAAVSAYAYAHDRERALAAGFEAHLSKPVDPNDLVALVLRLTRTH